MEALIAMVAVPPIMYNCFRPIAYTVPTVVTIRDSSGKCRAFSGWSPGGNCTPSYDPFDDVNNLDLKTRLLRLASVVKTTHEKYVQRFQTPGADFEPDELVLKVFVVPEFYFRPETPIRGTQTKAYSFKDYTEYIIALKRLFSRDEFKHWFFICGTILYSRKERDVFRKYLLVYNELVAIKGGNPIQEFKQIKKYRTSNIDGVEPAFMPDKIHEITWTLCRNTPFNKQNYRLSPLGIGMEICLEHLVKVLKHTRKELKKPGVATSSSSVKLHVLTAGGMPTENGSVAANMFGYFFRNDGYFILGKPIINYNQVQNYIKGELGIEPEFKYADLLAEAVLTCNIPFDGVPIELTGNQLIGAPDNAIESPTFYTANQQVVIYKKRGML